MRLRIRHLGAIASTNIEVKRAIDEGEPEGLVVRADRQTGGYGRQGRTWQSPEGGLYFSMLLRPNVDPSQLSMLALVAGMAVRRALARLVGAQAAPLINLKWPNDIVVVGIQPGVAFAKICGISSEARKGAVCVGVGVNVHRPADARPAETGSIKNIPVYAADLPNAGTLQEGLRDRVFNLIMEEFVPLYGQWCTQGFAPFADEYAQHDALRGKRIDVVDRAGEPLASGVASGIGSDGCLLVASPDGRVTSVASGEAHIL